jgi:tetratricopeptide (TPR) repeat protein
MHRDSDKTLPPKWNFLPYIGESVDIGTHVHLEGEELKELLPWLTYAVRLDPHNVDAYILGGWTAWKRLGRVDEGMRFLKRGLANNPGSWRIYTELGYLYLAGKNDFTEALANLERAEELLISAEPTAQDLRKVYTFKAYCHERLGDNEKAVENYERILELFPGDRTTMNRISQLSSY